MQVGGGLAMRTGYLLGGGHRFAGLILGVILVSGAPAAATDVSGNCPPGGFTAAGSPWNFTGGVTVSAGTTCTVQAGATLNGNGNDLTVNSGGTLNAVGTSAAQRDVVFTSVRVFYQSGSTG